MLQYTLFNSPDILQTSTQDFPASPMNNIISDKGGHLSLRSQKFFEEKKNEQKEPNEHLYFNFEFYRTSLITFNVRFFNLSCE